MPRRRWQAGLLNHVVPAAELDAKVEWLVDRIVDKSPTAIRRGKYAMRAIEAMSFDQGIAYTESQIALLAMTEDAKEGLASFNEKRRPQLDRALKRCLRARPPTRATRRAHSRAASDAGTPTGMSSSICAMPLPSGSKRAEAGPPPASASCSMKFIASIPGSAKRSTRPFTRCAKWRLHRLGRDALPQQRQPLGPCAR